MWVISQIYGSIPLIVLLLLYIAKKFGWRFALGSLIGIGFVIFLADRISVELFKEVFQRWRPTHNLDLGPLVHTVTDFSGVEYRGGRHSFVSSHATNFFGMAMFFWYIIKPDTRKIFFFIFGWASIVCYSRIYLGVHYPSDIICGGILGCLIGWAVGNLFMKFVSHRLLSTKHPV
jgi:undecaprenyl-diphosphatase